MNPSLQADAVAAAKGVSAGAGGRGWAGMRRVLMGLWLAGIAGFAALHAAHLGADFPNHSPWIFDWAKYTDEGWYGNAAARAHLFGNWYVAGDFNPAVALPVWPFLEWLVFFATGVSVQAARALAVGVFLANLLLSYWLLRARGPRSSPTNEDLSVGAGVWPALLAVTLLATSPFLYCFSRLAILEPLLTAFTLAALNVAVRLERLRKPLWGAAGAGALMTLAALTKTTAVFLIPAVAWAMLAALRAKRRLALQCLAAAGGVLLAGYGLWMALVVRLGLFRDYKYTFFVNDYPRPGEWYWPLVSFWWSIHGGLWADKAVYPLAIAVVLGAVVWRKSAGGRRLLGDPVFGASVLGIAGTVFFMTYQNHPQPRYYAPVAFFSIFLAVRGTEALRARERGIFPLSGWPGMVGILALTACMNGADTLSYATHPEYTFARAAAQLARYIDAHPNGNRLLVSISGDQITLMTHLRTLCDDFGTTDLPEKIGQYRPGWYAAWNDIDEGTLEDLHTHYSLEQVAGFPAFDHPQRRILVLFKLHPLPGGQVRDPQQQNLKEPLPGDAIEIPMQ